jgi:thioredoxin-related protein
MNLKSTALLVAVASLLVGAAGADGYVGCTSADLSLDQALAKAEKAEKPLLIKVGTDWCSACKAFDKAAESAGTVQTALRENAVLYQVDAEKGVGKDVAKSYRVWSYPTFILTNSHGQVLDRWMGFEDSESFLVSMTEAVDDPVTLDERLARYRKSATEKDARKIANLRQHEGLYAEACAYYRRADELNPQSDINYEGLIFYAMSKGHKGGTFSVTQVKSQADAVIATDNRSDKDLLQVAYTMGRIAKHTKNTEDFVPYLQVSIEETEGVADEDLKKMRSKLLPDYALHVSHDTEQAVVYKKATMPEGWTEKADMLNNFAWWCFENEVNLKEADTMARKGVELAEPGTQKANVLDTLAEICNLTGSCEDAVELIRLAIAENPENEYFRKQLDRFETLLAEKN